MFNRFRNTSKKCALKNNEKTWDIPGKTFMIKPVFN